jgi:hypothetical protein
MFQKLIISGQMRNLLDYLVELVSYVHNNIVKMPGTKTCLQRQSPEGDKS